MKKLNAQENRAQFGEWAKKNQTIPDEEVFCENATIARHHVKKKIIKRNLLPYECSICGQGPIWQGMEMPLILDHTNGINNDNRLENLRFVCSNCDSQLPTYKARNRTS
jgi:ribosomal protein L44E